jgi:hypothetical protein
VLPAPVVAVDPPVAEIGEVGDCVGQVTLEVSPRPPTVIDKDIAPSEFG